MSFSVEVSINLFIGSKQAAYFFLGLCQTLVLQVPPHLVWALGWIIDTDLHAYLGGVSSIVALQDVSLRSQIGRFIVIIGIL